MIRRVIPALMMSLSLALAACGSDDSTSTSTTTVDAGTASTASTATGTTSTTGSTTTETAPATTETTTAKSPATTPATNGCKTVKAQGKLTKKSKKPTASLAAGKTYVVTLQTSCGDIEITLDQKNDPKTAASFASLVKSGFYDKLGVVRVVPDFVLQAGDPNGDGTGGASYQITEAPGNNAAYRKGVVAMAKTGSDPAGASSSQFFIVTGADAGLPPDYAIAGKVTKGQDVADTIGAIPPVDPTGAPASDGAPSTPVIIEKATLSQK